MSKKYRYERLKPGYAFECSSEGRITNDELLWKYRYPDEYVAVDVLWYDGASGRVLCYDTKYKESGWRKPTDLYCRVEIEEQREPLECWVGKNLVANHMIYETAAFCEPEHFKNEQFSEDLKFAVKFREVITPEKKELPDRAGLWIELETMKYPVVLTRDNDTFTLLLCDMGTYRKPLKGEWIYLDPILEQIRKDAE